VVLHHAQNGVYNTHLSRQSAVFDYETSQMANRLLQMYLNDSKFLISKAKKRLTELLEKTRGLKQKETE